MDMVSSLKMSNGDCWDCIASRFDQEIVKNIRGMFCPKHQQRDKLIWTNTKSSTFSVKSAYKLKEGDEVIGDKW